MIDRINLSPKRTHFSFSGYSTDSLQSSIGPNCTARHKKIPIPSCIMKQTFKIFTISTLHRFATSESIISSVSTSNSIKNPLLPSFLSSFSGYTVILAKVPPLFPNASDPGDKQITPFTSFTNRIFSVAVTIISGTSFIIKQGSLAASSGIDGEGYSGYKLRCSSSCEQNSRCLSTFFSCLHRIHSQSALPIAALHEIHQHVAVRHADAKVLSAQHAGIAGRGLDACAIVGRLREGREGERVVDSRNEN